MHLAQRLAAIVLTLGLSAGLVGCGFHLKYSLAMPMMPMYCVFWITLLAASC